MINKYHARRFTVRSLLLASMFAFSSNQALAQEQDQESDEEKIERIIVTVERRSQDLQDLAGTAIAFSGEDLKSLGIQDITDIAESTPGLEIGNNGGNIEVWIRGIGSSNNTELGDPAAATHLDGVYIPRPSGIGSVFFDISRVEVNVGPQGTLRGRNATAGSVNIIPWRPSIGGWNGSAEVEFGNFNQRVFSGALNIPVNDKIAFRVSGSKNDHDSYTNDVGPLGLELAEAADNTGFRFQTVYEPNDKLNIYLSFDSVREKGTGFTGTNFALPLGQGINPDDIDDPRDVVGRGFGPIQDTSHDGFKLELNYDLGFANLEYNASFRDLLYDYQAATPLSPDFPGVFDALAPLDESIDNFSRFQFLTDSESIIHELRLLSKDNSRLTYTAGAFLFQERQQTFLASAGDRGGFFQGAEFNQPNTDTDSISLYADATYDLSDNTRLTAGLRYTADEKTRQGVNARYAFALGGFDTATGNPFGCCLGVRVGTEGFQFAGFDRTIFDPDIDGDGTVSDQEFMDFYFDGIAQFGDRDNIDDIFANGTTPGGSENRPECIDTETTDGLICNEDGTFSFAVPISPDASITVQDGRIENEFVDWRFRVEHDLSADHLIYGLIATGHKSGGFNDTFTDPNGDIDLAPTFDEEQVTLYEFGSKNEFKWGSVPTTLNFSAFFNDYKDQVFTNLLSVEQALEFNSGAPVDPADATPGALVVSFSFNAADSQIYGTQLDGKFELPHDISISWTALYLEAEVQDSQDIQDSRFQADVAPDEAVFQSIDGNRLPRTPRFQFNATFSQAIEIKGGYLDYVISTGWRDSQFLTIFNSIDFQQPDNPRLRLDDTVDAYWTVDAGLGYSFGQNGDLRLEAYVNNLFDEVRTAATIITQFDNTRFFTRPRTFGARLRYTF